MPLPYVESGLYNKVEILQDPLWVHPVNPEMREKEREREKERRSPDPVAPDEREGLSDVTAPSAPRDEREKA